MKTSTPRFPRLRPIPAALWQTFGAAALLAPGFALANPSGGSVVGGQATITTPSANGTVINQATNSAIINWQQFNIGAGQYVQFVQPSSSAVALNRVIGGTPSEIFGSLQANGRVFLINPMGVLFAPGSSVDVGGLMATTADIKNSDFMSGNYVFSGRGAPGAAVRNAGTIVARDGGFVVLAGDTVSNSGLIQARLGQVVLASGSATTLDLDGNGLVSFAVNQASLSDAAGVTNSGSLLADGGRVLMTASVARDLVGSAVNNTGLVRAQGIANHDGKIELVAKGGDIVDSGTLDASNVAGHGGTVQVNGDRNITLAPTAQILADGTQGGDVHLIADGTLSTVAGSLISARGSAGNAGFAELSGHGNLRMRGDVKLGKGGTLLIDPTDITIANGSGYGDSSTVYETTLESQLQDGTNVQLIATNTITMTALSDGKLDGIGAYGGTGSLLLGTGTLTFDANQNPTFTPNANGYIHFANASNTIQVGGALTLLAGTNVGTGVGIDVGNLTGSSISLTGGNVSTGNLTASSGSLNVLAAGSIKVGNIATTSFDTQAADASVTLKGGGSVTTGDIATLAETSSGGTSNASIAVTAYGGAVSVGNLSTQADDLYKPLTTAPIESDDKVLRMTRVATNAASAENANANVTLAATGAVTATSVTTSAQSAVVQGALSVNAGTSATVGSIATSAHTTLAPDSGDQNAQAFVAVNAGAGDLRLTGPVTTTVINDGSAGVSGDIVLTDSGGTLNTGALSAQFGTINLSNDTGNIVAGDLTTTQGFGSITASAGKGSISVGNVSSFGGTIQMLANTGLSATSVTANYDPGFGGDRDSSISLGTNSGTLSVSGPIKATAAADAGSGHTATANIALVDGGGNILVGDVTSAATGDTVSSAAISMQASGTLTTGNLSASASGTAAGASDAPNSAAISLQGGTVNTGNLTTVASSSGGGAVDGGITVTAGSGGATLGNLKASAASSASGGGANTANAGVQVTAAGGALTVGSLTNSASASSGYGGSATTSGNVTLTNSAGSVTTADITTANALTITANGASGNIKTGTLDGGLSTLSLSSSGTLAIGNTTLSAGTLSVSVGSGDFSTGDVTASTGGLNVSTAKGNLTLGNVSSAADATLTSATGTLTTGQISSSGAGTLAGAAGVTSGSVSTNGNFSATSSAGNVQVGNIASGGDATLSAAKGTLTASDIRASNITLSSGTNFSYGDHTMVADGALSITSGGMIAIDASSLSGETIAISSAGNLSLTGGTTIGAFLPDSASARLHAATVPSIGLRSSGGDLLIQNASVNGGRIDLNGGNIHFADGSTVSGTQVAMTGTGLVDAGGTRSSINAGALSVTGNKIDFSSAVLTVGNGIADFGSDPTLLSRLGAVAPGLLPSTSGPNASFSAADISLGSLSVSGGYVYLRTNLAALPSIGGSSNVFLDFQPLDPNAAFQVGFLAVPDTLRTFVIGGSAQNGNIIFGNGSQTFDIRPQSTNFVIDTAGLTYYPSALGTNGQVIVLGTAVESPPPVSDNGLVLEAIPLTEDQYRTEYEDPALSRPTSDGHLIDIHSVPPSGACATGAGA